MTINEIIIEALHDPQNWDEDGVNWNFIDSDLWLHPESKKFSDDEKILSLDNFPDELIPSIENGGLYIHPFTLMDGTTESRVSLTNPRVTHPVK